MDAPPTGFSPLHFYFLGNKKPVKGEDGAYEKLTIDISDQSSELPVISYAASKQRFEQGVTDYTVEYNWLLNQCALVKFDTENIYNMSNNTYDNNADALYKTTQAITIYGMDNEVTVRLSQVGTNDHFNWAQSGSGATAGAITMYKASTDTEGAYRYAIVHHGTYNVTEGNLEVAFNPTTDPYGYFGTYKLQGKIAMNDFFQSTTGSKDGDPKQAKLDLVWHSGAFSIASGTYVVFSRGNLQYANLASGSRAAQTWRFAKHQYDFVGGTDDGNNQQGNVVLLETTTDLGDARSNNEKIGDGGYYGWIDLFGWGTGNNPTLHTTGNTDYTDWHEYGLNNIVNSGKPNNTSWWTTLSHNEWNYVINRTSKAKVGLATITGVAFGSHSSMPGLVILPDQFTNPYSSWKPVSEATTTKYAQWNDNTYSVSQWIEMEKAGAVFLPATGWRNGTNWRATLDLGTALEHGAYYSSTQRTQTTSVYSMRFGTDNALLLGPDRLDEDYYMAGDNGHNVRLVRRLN